MSDQAKSMQEVMEAVTAAREAADALDKKSLANEAGLSDLKEKHEKAEAALEDFDKKNKEIVVEMKKREEAEREMGEKIKELEIKAAQGAQVARTPMEQKSMALADELKAMETFAVKGFEGMSEMEKKNYLRTDDNAQGGFLVQEAYDDMIIKKITETDPMRQVSRIKRIDANSIRMFLRETLVATNWTGEGVSFTESTSTYSQPEIPVHSITSKTLITNRMLLASSFNMDNEIMGDFAESRLQKEGAAFVTGDGVHKPRGFTDSTASVPTKDSSGSSTYTFDDLIALTGELKTGYNPIYAMNRKELAFIRTLKDGASNYIWRAGNLGAGVPNAINGYAYIEMPSMADKATNALPVAFADFARLYCIVDSWQAIMLRNPYKEDGKVQFSMEAFVGGDVVLPEAGVLLKTVA